jgi:hypothetical protein
MFRFLYALAQLLTLSRAISLALSGKPYALTARLAMPQLRKAAQREAHRSRIPPQRTNNRETPQRRPPPHGHKRFRDLQ